MHELSFELIEGYGTQVNRTLHPALGGARRRLSNHLVEQLPEAIENPEAAHVVAGHKTQKSQILRKKKRALDIVGKRQRQCTFQRHTEKSLARPAMSDGLIAEACCKSTTYGK